MTLPREFSPRDDEREDGLPGAARAGDEAAFGVLLDRHRPGLQAYCALTLGESQAADEAMREIVLTAWRERSLIPAAGSARIWLYRIAVRVCFEALEAARDEFWRRRSFDQLNGE